MIWVYTVEFTLRPITCPKCSFVTHCNDSFARHMAAHFEASDAATAASSKPKKGQKTARLRSREVVLDKPYACVCGGYATCLGNSLGKLPFRQQERLGIITMLY